MCVPGIYNGIYVLIKIIQDASVCVCVRVWLWYMHR